MMIKKQKSEKSLIRINKYLANAGVASRRKVDEMVQEGKVRINGKVITSLGTKIDPGTDKVFVDGRQIVILDEPVYIVLNKPKDAITTASDERGRSTVMDYIRIKHRVYPVGRLDRNTTGVLLLTNDGEFANRLMHPKFEVKKAYKVTLDKALTREDADKLSHGVRLSEGMTKSAKIHFLPGEKNKVVGIIIHEGRNRQVHRMFEAFGYEVYKLDRVGYADITYEGLPRGRWRYLTKTEVRKLYEIAGMDKTAATIQY
jgi:23S rRNA pseudouridine2605 synthase